jgi:hypothetical protein
MARDPEEEASEKIDQMLTASGLVTGLLALPEPN